jgi:hypothetical protein
LAEKDDESKSHPPYSPDLAPSNFHLFVTLKDALQRCYFANDEELKHSVGVKSSNGSGKSFMHLPYNVSHKGV